MQFSPTAKYLTEQKLCQTEFKNELDSIFFVETIVPQTTQFSRQLIKIDFMLSTGNKQRKHTELLHY
jgi:hypothetical protein